jgi:hypothetical protein
MAVPCTRYASQLFLHNGRRVPARGYADEAKDSEAKNGISPSGAEFTRTAREDPDITAAENPEVQEAPALPDPVYCGDQSASASPHLPKSRGLTKAVSFKLEETNDPKRAAAQLQKALAQTSMRKKLGWSEPLRGINPAYDMAIDYLRNDSKEKLNIIKNLESSIRRERESNNPLYYICLMWFLM